MYENPDETEQTWQTRKQNKHGNEYPSLINNHFVTRDTRIHALLQMDRHVEGPNTTEQNEALYDIDSDEQARMHTLLQRAMNNEHQTVMPDERRVTRSSGRKFEWNSAMNEGDVVLEKKD